MHPINEQIMISTPHQYTILETPGDPLSPHATQSITPMTRVIEHILQGLKMADGMTVIGFHFNMSMNDVIPKHIGRGTGREAQQNEGLFGEIVDML